MFSIKCKVDGGRIPDATRKSIADAISKYDGKVIQIEIKQAKNQRSCQQNKYYWAVIVPSIRSLFNDTYGNDMTLEEVHEYLKRNIGRLTKAVQLPQGGYDIVTDSSAKLTTAEFEIYNEKCRVFGAQNGIAIPLPREIIIKENENDTK
jgi:hypothetical protein